VDIQRIIGSDIMMALDECTPFPCERKYAEKSLKLTHQWLERGFGQFEKTQALYNNKQWYFPIVQGSVYGDLREKSAEFAKQFNAGGYAIGGLSVGEPAPVMYEMTELVTAILPEEKPRYLMGVGTPANIVECIARGIDMFDCVMPTRNGRNGMLFTWKGIINIRNEKWKNDFSAIDPEGTAFSDTLYSRAYLRHLFISGEMLGPQIASLHNLAFYLSLVKKARQTIINGGFEEWKEKVIPHLTQRL
jgi:queuine tRNA-ribosyltransferase